MERRGMEAVAAKSVSKRRPALKRKGGMSIVIAVGKPKPEMEEEADEEMSGKSLTCPKCGAELADTPENREYIASKKEDEYEDEGEGAESEEEMDD